MRAKTVTRWAIMHKDIGLYVGQCLTRRSAIAEHVSAYAEDLFRKPTGLDGPLSQRQKEVWAKCRAQGDKAVKVTITWEVPE